MFLDTVNISKTPVVAGHKKPAAFAAWKDYPYTLMQHHGSTCCDRARSWLLAMDFTLLGGSSLYTGPRWLRARYQWGPSAHPSYWCETVRQKMLDCGAHAALAHECFASRGIASFPVQLVQQYTMAATAHWRDQWVERNIPTDWIKDDLIYHEGNAVLLRNGNLKIWDASAALWMDPLLTKGYGSLVAVRIHDAAAPPDTIYAWDGHNIKPNSWQEL
jgi:hypothetical protein